MVAREIIGKPPADLLPDPVGGGVLGGLEHVLGHRHPLRGGGDPVLLQQALDLVGVHALRPNLKLAGVNPK